jgi:hypothetical protein
MSPLAVHRLLDYDFVAVLDGRTKKAKRDMFGRWIPATKPSPSPVAPDSERAEAQPAGEQQSRALPTSLLRWLLPLALVVVLIAAVAAPGVALALAFVVVLAALAWFMIRRRWSQNWGDYERVRNDRFFRQRRDEDGPPRNDRFR